MKFKILGIISFSFLFLILGSSVAFAQETPEQIAAKYGITFPIAELGGCTDYASCRTFCEDPIYHSVCIDFAKKKGFHKEERFETQKNRFIERAKVELGCDSEEACREFCGQETNWEKCGEFAKRHNLSGGETHNPEDTKILERAKSELGCTNYGSCLSFCIQEANRQKCSEFANKVGIRGGEQHVGPGGCTSEETCKAFCSDPINFDECSKFGGGPIGEHRGGFRGPGGCSSEESCRSYCENNPQECTIIVVGEHGRVANPMKAKEEYARHCRENPEKCIGEHQGPFGSKEGREEFERFCSNNPDKCGQTEDLIQLKQSIPNCPEGQYNGPGQGGPCTLLEKSQDAFRCSQAGKYWDGNSCSESSPSSGTHNTGGLDPAGEYSKDPSIPYGSPPSNGTTLYTPAPSP